MGFEQHDANPGSPFDERRVGLDHLSWAVESREELDAWLARLNPLAIIPVSYLFGGLLVGGDAIQPAGIAQMLQGVILFVVIGGELLLRYRVRYER